MKIGIVGLGLMGGSIAKAFKQHTAHVVVGVDRDESVLAAAKADGSIDAAGDISSCDVVFLCLFPQACVDFFADARFLPGAIVTDICGVKRFTADELERRASQKGVRYVGCHPMAGRERSSYASSTASLFHGSSFIITTTGATDADAVASLSSLALEMGCARVTMSTPREHDAIIAYTSQLAHVVSNAYVKNTIADRHTGYSAGSFLDLTRVARLDPAMWSELFLLNRDDLLSEIDEFMANVSALRGALAAGDTEQLFALLKEGSDRKKRL